MSGSSVAVIGLGYVGQPLAGALASVGYSVVGVDTDRTKIAHLSETCSPTIYEPGLAETFARGRSRLTFTTSHADALRRVDVVCITVGTPTLPDGSPDITALDSAVHSLGPYLRPGQTIILRSTVAPGTTFRVAETLASLSGLRAGDEFYVAFSPERTLEGLALYEMYNLPTIVGGINAASTDKTVAFFERLGARVVTTSSPTIAELCKIADNLYRALNIAFANEFGNVCEAAKVNAYEVVDAVNAAYPRTFIFRPGLGADGPCLSKDPLILRNFARSSGVITPLVDASIDVNREATLRVAREVQSFLAERSLDRPRIVFLGLAFKGMPETDDVRGSAAQIIYDALTGAGSLSGAELRLFDPLVREFRGHSVSASLDECLSGAHVALFLSNHPALRNIAVDRVLSATARPLLIVDAWHNVVGLDPQRPAPAVVWVRFGDGT